MRLFYYATIAGVCLVGCLGSLFSSARAEEENANGRFREVLELAGLGPEMLAAFPEGTDYQEDDWRLLIQLLYRLGQYPTTQQDDWALTWSEQPEPIVGELFNVVGTMEKVETLLLPEPIAQAHELVSISRCQFRFSDAQSTTVGVVLSKQVPARWQSNEATEEPIRFRGVLLRTSAEESQPVAVFLTQHLAWYPRQGVPTGQLLLARHGMDVALLDEVKHRRPFVRPEVSREGESFYACLAAMKRTDAHELSKLAKQNVAQVADRWREIKSADLRDDDAAREQRALAAAVLERSEQGLSSVAPMFMQPEEEVGELVRIEGTARRAVRIAVADQPEIDSYYELEVFPPDSQNLPVVCCVSRLPEGFPTGDAIREPVRVVGVFFKSWLYRTRKVNSAPGETGRQQRRVTPIVVGAAPTWLNSVASQDNRWGLWGGIVFLIALAIVWIGLTRLARRERLQRSANRRAKIDIPGNEPGVEPAE